MRLLLASLMFATACSSAYADRPAAPQPPGPRTALAIAPEKVRAPYDVQIVTENGETAPTYALRDRFYVQGNLNQRYTIRVSNPTARRVEAVVTVDGLDVVDGEAGDLRKRGYIVPAYGEVRIEGFRTSLSDVATFRFSSVDGSYAGQKGKARNVGVIAVAIFEEQAPPPEQQIIIGGADQPYDYRDDIVTRPRPMPRDHAGPSRAKKSERYEPAAEAAPSGAGDSAGARVSSSRPMPAPPPHHHPRPDMDEAPARTNRPGLGTEFGEQRYSAASFTKFMRAAHRPIAIAELRYNDVAGLVALGIPVQPMPDAREIMARETADPFPGDRFARPPGR
jgi:hypothetical protein